MDITQVVELAKRGSRLDNGQYWRLADALVSLSDGAVGEVAIQSDRKESTLLQYRRAAERWPITDRVDGVSFSAHRVALSASNPRDLLLDLKARYGSPTVRQVREAMGLEAHPSIEHLRKAWLAITKDINTNIASNYIRKIDRLIAYYDSQQLSTGEAIELAKEVSNRELSHTPEEPKDTQPKEKIEKWTPPIRSTDLLGS